MRLSLLLFIVLTSHITLGQDTLRVSFSEESDTLARQRFVDRYENVFMTKVPTRHMFKVGLTFLPNYVRSTRNRDSDNSQLDLGYEYKILPSWSIGGEAGLIAAFGGAYGFSGLFTGKVYTRWYYDMRRRILAGKNVNNFTGNFLALIGEKQWGKEVEDSKMKRLGIEFGMQRRFFNQGRLELGIGLFYQDYRQTRYPSLFAYDFGKSSLAIISRTSMGLAFGDWKQNRTRPLCEVLHCDDYVQQQWKLLWPNLYISSAFSNAMVGIGYERKIRSSPLSVNTQVTSRYLRIAPRRMATPLQRGFVNSDVQAHLSSQLRIYAWQRKAIRTGTGGNNLSGLYIGPYTDYLFYHGKTIFNEGENKKHFGVGAGGGYQQTLFKKAYVDLSINVSHNLLKVTEESKRYLGSVAFGFGLVL